MSSKVQGSGRIGKDWEGVTLLSQFLQVPGSPIVAGVVYARNTCTVPDSDANFGASGTKVWDCRFVAGLRA